MECDTFNQQLFLMTAFQRWNNGLLWTTSEFTGGIPAAPMTTSLLHMNLQTGERNIPLTVYCSKSPLITSRKHKLYQACRSIIPMLMFWDFAHFIPTVSQSTQVFSVEWNMWDSSKGICQDGTDAKIVPQWIFLVVFVQTPEVFYQWNFHCTAASLTVTANVMYSVFWISLGAIILCIVQQSWTVLS